MKAVDTSMLLAAHRAECGGHARSASTLASLCEGREPWGLPLDVINEFLRLVTHERLFNPPSPSVTALRFVHALVNSPACKVLLPGERSVETIQHLEEHEVIESRIAACCRRHDVSELLTAGS
jgi:uncharacterized protein